MGDFAYDWAIAKTKQILKDKTDWTEKFRENYFASYDSAWDTDMHWGCLCDQGYRGPSCALVECPSATDPLDANGRKVYGCYGHISGMDCSGRGICDYSSGTCKCFSGYAGTACEKVEEMA